MAGPLNAITGNPVLAYNVTLILFWALSGWSMYAVAVRLTRDQAAALIAALIFTLCPYRTEMYLEFNMEMTFGIPWPSTRSSASSSRSARGTWSSSASSSG